MSKLVFPFVLRTCTCFDTVGLGSEIFDCPYEKALEHHGCIQYHSLEDPRSKMTTMLAPKTTSKKKEMKKLLG